MREANKHQGTGAWFNERTGKLTGSRMGAACSFNKDGKESSKRRELKVEILAERMTGNIVDKFVSRSMQWGIDMEPQAKAAFEQRFYQDTGELMIVQDVGFLDHPRIQMCGVSPDGFCTDENVIEVKCPESHTHISYLLEKKVPEEYKPQMCLQKAVTGRDV